jgi:hypothetical protein
MFGKEKKMEKKFTLEKRTVPRDLARDAHLAHTGTPRPSEGPWPKTARSLI